ncbi:DoxX family protein [Haloterrigena gelatinilytica]|uniref:DoxX family protein n=1 Tax=Haloterrigena gelatinilytica TaxID=2741724 RepID=UPI003741FEE2
MLVSRAALVAALLVSVSETARAHEEYVVDEEREVAVAEFLRESLTDPLVVGPLLAGALLLLAAVGGYLVVRPVQRDVAAFRAVMREYTAYVPWLLRISIGIPLIGAGFGGYLISPALGLEARLLQVALGFLLLFGLATRLAAVLALAVYLVGLAIDSILLLQLEFVPGTLAIALLGGGRPSGDHVLQRVAGTPGTVYGRFDPIYDYAREFQTRIDPYRRFLPTIVRVGPELWVLGAGLSEVGLGLALIIGFFTRASAATAIGVFSLTLFALPDDPVLAHVSLFGLASALLITGSGPYAVDGWLEGYGADEEADAPNADVPDAA